LPSLRSSTSWAELSFIITLEKATHPVKVSNRLSKGAGTLKMEDNFNFTVNRGHRFSCDEQLKK
jgi:hypothetical protein